MVEDDYEDGEKTESTVVVTLQGERWEHADDTSDAKGAHKGREGRWGRAAAFPYILK